MTTKEVVLRAYFETDFVHASLFKESRERAREEARVFREIEEEVNRGGAFDLLQKRMIPYGKYCLRVLNPDALSGKFGRGYAVNKRTISVRGTFVADVGGPVPGRGECWGHEAGFIIKQVLRKED